MRNANDQPEFKELLNTWETPEIPASFDQRVFAAYQQQIRRAPWWQRFFTASIRVPVPALAAVLLLCAMGGGLALTKLRSVPTQIQAQPIINTVVKTEYVQVPVVQEKIVTRTIYIEKKSAPTTAAAPVLPAVNTNSIKLASHVVGENAYTNTDLSGYQPVDEMRVRIIKGNAEGGDNEK